VRTTHDLRWPADPDLYRDIAQAQTIADGSLLDDPYYRGETLWHNPLAPLVVAALSKLFDAPVPATYVRAGAYLNLLGLAGFYLWVARLAGAGAATVATLGFVFHRDPWAPGWVSAAYSPWLFAMTCSQGPFYFGLLGYRRALISGRRWRYAASGLLLGVTFLAAAPPAFILAGVVIVAAVLRGAGVLPSATAPAPFGARVRSVLVEHGVLALVAAAIASPLLYSIVWRYRLHVLNTAPTSWEWAGLGSVAEFARTHAGWPAAIAAFGAASLARRGPAARTDVALVAAFAAVTAVFLAYRAVGAWAGIALPQFVPSHYFVFYLKALQWVLVGVSAAAVLSRLPVSAAVSRLVPTAVAVIVIAAALPQYRTRGYFESARETSLAEEGRQNLREAYDWIRANTSAADVFLASPDVALQVVGPAGRKVVVAGEVYSSPYVDWAARSRSSRWMWRALREKDGAAWRALARASDVSYVISSRQEDPALDDLFADHGAPGLEPAFKSGGLRIHRLAAAP
jgi:hypothetical protein